ncbi:MAG: DUF5686 and carboxypeptidase regulatory-like domain-containing protein, partial [Bacteroidota bacterium]
MRKFLCLVLLAFTGYTHGQSISGTLTDATSGEPLPFASIYVAETGSGTVTNVEGNYVLRLSPGRYTVKFQSIGYVAQERSIQVGSSGTILDIALVQRGVDLQTIDVISSGEDVSYPVIRRAIAKAGYHRQQVDRYEALVYIKGTGKINKIPGLFLAMMDEEDREDIDTTRVYTGESVSRVIYERPNTFSQDVISLYQSGEAQADATPFIFGSFYQPEIAGAISPLSTRAFGYYRFEHQGVFVEGDELINKIKVTSRSRGDDVFNGYIYIVEDDWSIHSLDLEVYKFGIRFVIKQTYAPLQAGLWMPISGIIDVYGKLFGIDFEYHYLSTLSEYDVQLNGELPEYVEVIDERSQAEDARRVRSETRNRESEEILAEGGEITRKDLRRLIREYEREERRQLEEPEVEREFVIRDDSAVGVSDTAFWNDIRPVPLTSKEQESYIIDAIEAAGSQTPQRVESEEQDSLTIAIGAGGTRVYRTSGSRNRWRRSIFPQPFFNPVEGYVLGATLGLKRFGISKTSTRPGRPEIEIFAVPRYGFAREKMTLHGGLNLAWSADANESSWSLVGGRNLRQFDPDWAIDPWVNVFTSLFSHDNFLRLYERRFVKTSYNHIIDQDWEYGFQASYEDRTQVINNSDAAWFRDDNGYLPNFPFNNELLGTATPVGQTQSLGIGADFLWRPGQRYTRSGDSRDPIPNSSPELSLRIRAGLPALGGETEFVRLEAGFRNQFRFGARGRLDLLVKGGFFPVEEVVDFADFAHFPTTNIALAHPDPLDAYRLLPIYINSTAQEYGQVFAHYQFRKFLLTRIWEIQKLGWREDLFVNYLYTPTSENYSELGYTIDGIFRVLRVEFVTSWRDFEYEDFGVRLSFTTNFSGL